MAPPTDIPDPAPLEKHKKKKKKKKSREEPEETAGEDCVEIVSAAITEGQRSSTEPGGGDVVKKKKKKKKQKEQETNSTVAPVSMTTQTKQAEKRKQGEEPEVTPPTEREPEVAPPPKRKKKEKRHKTNRTSDHFNDFEDMDLADCSVSERDLAELELYIPDVRTKAKDVLFKIKRYDLPRLRHFQQQGLKLRWGKYTYLENLQIRRNVADFLKLTGIESVDELFFPSRYPNQEQSLKALRSKHNFYSKIADGLLRTCEQVYIRGRKIFDNRNNRGRFSEEENWQLQKLHTMHGNDWKKIGNTLERSVYACEKRFSHLGENNGPWSPEEEQRFFRVMKKHLKRSLRTSPSPGSSPGPTFAQLCSKLPWTKISHKVQTRSWVQCRRKWFGYLKTRLKAAQPREIQQSPIHTRIRLIHTLNRLEIEEVFNVDWVEIAKSVGGLTPMCAQKIFHRMKVSRIPNWTTMSFGEMVDVLVEKELPRLQQRLDGPDPGPESDPSPDHFSLEQLFPKQMEQFMEVDNS